MADRLVSYQQTINYPKTVYHDEPEFTFSVSRVQLAPGQLMTFVHIDVFHWSPSTLRRLHTLWPSVRQTLPRIVYASGDVSDAKWVKFIKRFGFVPILEDCLCSDGNSRPIYAHFKKE